MFQFPVQRGDHLLLRVQDTGRSIAFYRDLRGELGTIDGRDPGGNAVGRKGPALL